MAHSPSPGSSALPGSLHASRRLSQSPPPSQQPLSKRDKRRTMIDQRLRDIATTFTSTRDLHLRSQLNSLSRDMQFITKAELYSSIMLEDGSDNVSLDIPVNTSGSVDGDNRFPLGKHAARFVEDVNDEMEKRDAALTDIDIVYKKHLDGLKLDFKFAAEVAEAECQALKESARARVTSSIQTKKKQMQREKDQLDSADSSFLMNSHILTAITAPGSPGGVQSNRKTRHTRHRLDPEGLEATDPHRRKRKAQSEIEMESPAPILRHTSMDTFGPLLWDRSKGLQENDQSTPITTVERFFNSKELASHNRSAMNSVAQTWSDRRSKRSQYGNARTARADNGIVEFPDPDHRINNLSDDEAEVEDVSNLVAPLMDRTGSHATRSTRINQLDILAHRDNIEDEDPQRSYGSAVLDASLARSKVAQSKDVEAPMTTGMSAQDVSDDLSIMQSLMGEV